MLVAQRLVNYPEICRDLSVVYSSSNLPSTCTHDNGLGACDHLVLGGQYVNYFENLWAITWRHQYYGILEIAPKSAATSCHLVMPAIAWLGGGKTDKDGDWGRGGGVGVAFSFHHEFEFEFFVYSQSTDLRLSGPPSGQGAGSGARTRDRSVPADLRADSQATVLPTPPFNHDQR
ncbi:hypothetical protein PoB_003246800 [Plakobranchus ocellatus]|uniref:Uncharacterized protein n=1 Tax=Plakobranchus ocellatus TaxID=259542 RepID=A0AAV4AFA0_9GAST|nr:hypothetical protein PoB_003246800 [Plakobranchus ocellatus]